MMKRRNMLRTILFALCALAVCALAGCGAFDGIRSAFTIAGYSETPPSDDYRNVIVSYLGDEFEDFCSVHFFTKNTAVIAETQEREAVLILEFTTSDDLKNALSGNLGKLVTDVPADATGTVNYDKSRRVNGNCFLFYSLTPRGAALFARTK